MSSALDSQGNVQLSGGSGIAAGNLSIVTAEGTVSVNAGETGGLEIAFIAAGVIPFTPVGGLIDTRVSLDGLGARATFGGVTGREGLVFIGPTFPLGEPVNFNDVLNRLIEEGSGVPGRPGPPPPSAIPPF